MVKQQQSGQSVTYKSSCCMTVSGLGSTDVIVVNSSSVIDDFLPTPPPRSAAAAAAAAAAWGGDEADVSGGVGIRSSSSSALSISFSTLRHP